MKVSCKICNKELKRYKKQNSYYCSHLCYSKQKSVMLSGKNNPVWKGGILKLKCLVCKKPFQSKRFGIGRNPKFCTHECYSKYRSEKYVGKNHPNFKGELGGRITRPIRWLKRYSKWMKAILKRDNNKCQHCGTNELLQVHHIQPLAQLVTNYIKTHGKLNSNDDSFYDENNGITLCRKCHIIVHKTKLGELLETQTNS